MNNQTLAEYQQHLYTLVQRVPADDASTDV